MKKKKMGEKQKKKRDKTGPKITNLNKFKKILLIIFFFFFFF